jgi:hypothetical protein
MAKKVATRTLLTVGRHVMIDLPELHSYEVEAKVDTGAFRTVIHCLGWREIEENGKKFLEAKFDLNNTGEQTIKFADFFQKEFKSSFGEKEKRYCVKTTICIGKKKIKSSVSLTDRSEMRFQVLLGRKTLLRKFLVDVSKKYA